MLKNIYSTFITFLIFLGASESALAGKLDDRDEKALIAKALTNTRIKQKTNCSDEIGTETPQYLYTQTEAYLKVMLPSLGRAYVEDDIDQNVNEFIQSTNQYCAFMSVEEAIQIVQNERRHPNHFVFYNALRCGHDFAYDIVDLMRQAIEIKAPFYDKRRYARMFDALFDFSKGDSPINSFINDYVRTMRCPDTAKKYQLRAASTNMFFFGNTRNTAENTPTYISAGFIKNKNSIMKIFNSGEIIEYVFSNMGFDQQTLPKRIQRYKELFEKYEYFWRRGDPSTSLPFYRCRF